MIKSNVCISLVPEFRLQRVVQYRWIAKWCLISNYVMTTLSKAVKQDNRSLVLIGQLRKWKQTKEFFHILAAVKFKYRMLCHSKQKMQAKEANSLCYRIGRVTLNTECITIVWFDPKFFLFDVNYMFSSLWICYHGVNFTYGNYSINQDSAHWPMGIC